MNRRSFFVRSLASTIAAGVAGRNIGSGHAGIGIGVPREDRAASTDWSPEYSEWVKVADDRRDRLQEALRQKQAMQGWFVDALPPHIANKKSWSDAYKLSVFTRERKLMDAEWEKMKNFEDLLKSVGAPDWVIGRITNPRVESEPYGY